MKSTAISKETPADIEYDNAQTLSAMALRLAETYRTPPNPRNYEVWYAYASGASKAVSKEIGTILENNGSLDSYELDQIHREFLAPNEQERRQQELLGVFLDREMEKAVQRVHTHLATNEHHSGAIKKTAASLSNAATPVQVRETVEILLTENARMRAEAAKLNHDLDQTRVQVRKLRTSLEKARENEFRDPLTDISNRRYFERFLVKQIADAHKTRDPLCLVMADLDHFKAVNDNFGHQVGDDVLRYFASLLRKNIKGQDLVARYGGEEFAIVLPSTTVGNARMLIQRIMAQLDTANLVLSKGKAPIGKVTSSFGISQLREGDAPEHLIRRADAKLYEAKHAGRNRVHCENA